MKRVLIFANNDIGLYKFRKELIHDLISQGSHVHIAIPEGEMVQSLINIGCTFINIDVDRRGINPVTDFKLLVKYFKIINKIKPDMVITYTIKPNIYGGIASRIIRVPYAINITGLGTAFQNSGILKKLIVRLYRISCKKAKVIFFENDENQRVFIDNKIAVKENTCKLNGAGVNLDEYVFCDYPENNREIRFLFIGRVMKEKGIDELLKVAKRIKSKYDNVIFDIVGPLEDDYRDIMKVLKEQSIINYHGFQADVKPFVKEAHCFVLPSYHEGMANTLLEAGAMGRPLITSSIPGCKEAVIDGDTGYLVNVKDSEDLYNKMLEFIMLSLNDKKLMGYKSSEYIKKVFDKKIVVNKTIKRLRGE